MLTPSETAAHMRTILHMCEHRLKLSMSESQELLFSLAVQMKYGPIETSEKLYKELEADFMTFQQIAELAFFNNPDKREN